jgi:hypothetical protein
MLLEKLRLDVLPNGPRPVSVDVILHDDIEELSFVLGRLAE